MKCQTWDAQPEVCIMRFPNALNACAFACFCVCLQEREKEGLVEQVDRLGSTTQDNVKLTQKIASLEGQVSANETPVLTVLMGASLSTICTN